MSKGRQSPRNEFSVILPRCGLSHQATVPSLGSDLLVESPRVLIWQERRLSGLRFLVTLTEDWDLVPSIHTWVPHNCLRFQFKGIRQPLLASSGTHID